MAKHFVEGEELQAYLDGELKATRRGQVEKHLRECGECARLLGELKRVSATLQRWQVEPAPASLRPPTVESGPEKRPWWSRRMTLALVGTAAVALLAITLTLLDSSPFKARKSADIARRTEPALSPETKPEPPAAPPPASLNDQSRVEGRLEAGGTKRVSDLREQKARRDQPVGATGGVIGSPPESFAADQIEAYKAKIADAEKAEKDAVKQDEKLTYALESSPPVAQAEPKQQAGLLARTRASAPATSGLRTQAAGEEEAAADRALAQESAAHAMVAYQVWLTLEVEEFDNAKKKLLQTVEQAGGYIAQAHTAETPGQPRRADLVLRVPVPKFSALLDELRGLGRVTQEQQSNEELTTQVVDLEARLRNARATEQRLIAVLNERTGKVREILEVEREIAGTREEIERMEAQVQHLLNRVALATVTVALMEQFKAQLETAPVGTARQLRNAFVQGYESFARLLLGFVFFFARYGLNLLFWLMLVWLGWRLVRRPLLELWSRGFGLGSAWLSSK